MRSGSTRAAALAAAVVTACGGLSGCASWPKRLSARPCCVDRKWVVRRQPIWWHLFDVTVLEPLEQPFHLIRSGRKLFGAPQRAINLREGKVADTAFFTERDIAGLSAEQVRWGPTRPEDLPVPPLTVTKPKGEGKTPGMFVTDRRGVRYLLKLDPVDAPELLSGAEVVTSKLLYALGYHVPSYEVVTFKPEELVSASGLTITREKRTVAFGEAELRALVQPRVKDGVVRAALTKILDGDILGPARFKKFQDCAEVRALRVAYAWVNNIDTKDHNSLLVWDGQRTVGYLIDFGTSLGADAGLAGPKQPCAGWLNIVDLKEASMELLTFGAHRETCDSEHQPLNERVGLFTEHLIPDLWTPYAPNVAFKQMTDRDADWVARRIAKLTREQIAAAVAAGRYTDPADADYLIETLEARRRLIVQRYLDEDEDER